MTRREDFDALLAVTDDCVVLTDPAKCKSVLASMLSIAAARHVEMLPAPERVIYKDAEYLHYESAISDFLAKLRSLYGPDVKKG